MPPRTLFRYMLLKTAFAVAVLFAALASLVMLVDLLENLRYAAKVGADFGFAMQLTLVRTPALAGTMLPFVFLFGALWTFAQLNRRSELAVMRSAGLSIWRLVGPAALLAALTGILAVLFIDPVSARLITHGEKMRNEIRGRSASLVRVFGDGIWLRQRDRSEILLINAGGFDAERGVLRQVTIWRLSPDSDFRERIDAPEAEFTGRTLELRDARMKAAEARFSQRVPSVSVPAALSLNDLREGVPPPESMSIWDLPRFMTLADAAGLSTLPYRIRYHDLCSTPLKLAAMVLIAAIFSLGPVRQGNAARLALAALGSGFLLYVLSELATALGESGLAPPALAAWIPALAATIVAISILMRHEESA
jgi:lipopolysaccharide export system permease protein